MATYSTADELLIGDLTVSPAVKQKHVDAATREVDERLGFNYQTPFTQSSVSRPAWFLIKRIANYIASGRLLLETDQSGEDNGVHAYGLYLLQEVDTILEPILNGEINLSPPSDDLPDPTTPHGARVSNVDPYSQVEAFYGWAARPPVYFPYPGMPGYPLSDLPWR